MAHSDNRLSCWTKASVRPDTLWPLPGARRGPHRSPVVVVQYLSRRYCFTAVCVRKAEGDYEATLARRSPGLAPSSKKGTSHSVTSVVDDETFRSTSQVDALMACRRRVLELGGEMLSEISSELDGD